MQGYHFKYPGRECRAASAGLDECAGAGNGDCGFDLEDRRYTGESIEAQDCGEILICSSRDSSYDVNAYSDMSALSLATTPACNLDKRSDPVERLARCYQVSACRSESSSHAVWPRVHWRNAHLETIHQTRASLLQIKYPVKHEIHVVCDTHILYHC